MKKPVLSGPFPGTNLKVEYRGPRGPGHLEAEKRVSKEKKPEMLVASFIIFSYNQSGHTELFPCRKERFKEVM